jgi:F0F1-type ATP synthase assembly protein I
MKPDPKQMRQVMLAMAMGSQFVGASVAGAIIGWVIDRYLESAPIGTLFGGVLGVISGFVMILRTQKRFER